MTEGSAASKLKAFPKVFWVINGIELLERGAYYSLSAVFTVFIRASFQANGMSQADATGLAGTIGAVLFLLLYLLPVVTAPFSERVGYKTALTLVFALLAGGYASALFASRTLLFTSDGFSIVSSTSSNPSFIFLAVALIGLGAGIFKPIAAALVAQTSTEPQRNFAFSIYYACINIGALVFPLSVGLAALIFAGRDATIAFGTAAVLAGISLLLVLVVFRNVRPPQKDVNLLTGVKRLGEVFGYPAFLVLMVIYSGFWFMYAMSLTVITVYLGDFNRMPEWFNVLLQQSVNPGVIILITPLIGGFTQKHSSIVLMITGIIIYALGLVTIGFSGVWWLFIGGIVVFSVGELLTHPSYLSYVSKIAPPGKESTFLGYGFIPVGVGLFLGSSVGGNLYAEFALRQARPEMFWAIIASVGLVTAAALVVYNLAIRPKPAKDVAPGPARAEPSRRRAGLPMGGVALAAAVLLLVPALVGAAMYTESNRSAAPAEDDGPLGASSLSLVELDPVSGTTKTGDLSWTDVTFPENATGIATITLTWRDESAGTPTSQNAPDTLRLHVTYPNGTMVESEPTANPQSGEGKISLKLDGAPGAWKIGVEVVSAGSTAVTVGPLALPVGNTADAGNAWSVAVATEAA